MTAEGRPRRTIAAGARLAAALLLTGAAACAGCRAGRPADPPGAAVAVTNPYLLCAARDVLGADSPILSLSGPGACPGHFDMRPAQVGQLRGCRLLLRFDFQDSLEPKLKGLSEKGLKIVPVHIRGGMCEPASYAAALNQTAEALAQAGILDRAVAVARAGAAVARVRDSARRALSRLAASGAAGTPVISSLHQQEFCEWLGLNVVATFSSPDKALFDEINHAVQAGNAAGARIVVANLPEGRQAADALAGRLRATVAVFGNFPDPAGGTDAFDRLVADNVGRFIQAWGS